MGAYSFLWSGRRLALVLPLLLAFGGGTAFAQQEAQRDTQPALCWRKRRDLRWLVSEWRISEPP